MKTRLHLVLPAAALMLGASTLAAQTVFTDNFNSYTGTTTGGSPFYGTTGAYQGVQVPVPADVSLGNVGIGGSQALQLSGTSDNIFVLKAPGSTINLSQGAVTLSLYFQRTAGVNVSVPELGLVPTTASNISSGGGNGLSARINSTASPSYQVRNSATTQSGFTLTGSTATTVGNWYYFAVTIERLATTDQLSISSTLSNADNTGAVGTQLASISGTVTNSTLWNDSDGVFATFRAQGNGVGMIDNLAVSQIPEPSAFAGLAGLGALGLAASRRRRRT